MRKNINTHDYTTSQNCTVEISFHSETRYKDPFNEIDLDFVFELPDSNKKNVPAFWAGKDTWKVRYASPIEGIHKFRTKCSDVNNDTLHNLEGVVNISKYTGNIELFRHGPLKISSNRRYLEHFDGKPFFWLGDTWWHGFAKR